MTTPTHAETVPTSEATSSRATSSRATSSETTSGATSLADLPDLVAEAWRIGEAFTTQTQDRCGETMRRFVSRVRAQGVTTLELITPEHCSGFVDSATRDGSRPELTTRHARRAALRMFFRTLRELGHDVGDPTLDLQLPPRTSTAARPLTDLEIALGRVASRLGAAGGSSLQRAVCWALAEATAVTSEISHIRLGDLDDLEEPRWVRLPGTTRHDARMGELSEWGSRIVSRHVAALQMTPHWSSTTLLAYRGRGKAGQAAAQAAVCNAVGAVLTSASLSEESDVRPGSVRNWAGRSLFDRGLPLEKVAVRMGARSLDTVAEDIALIWRSR